MRAHIELRTQANIEAGMSPEEARFAALRQFGWRESIKEECRDQRGVRWLENLLQDIRYGARQLRKNPGFTAVAVLTLALGIGANTAIFSVVDAVLLKPLPFDQPGQLVQVWEAPSPGKRTWVSPGAFLDWRKHGAVFESLSLRQNRDMNLTGDPEPERVRGLAMSANGLEILRARPLLGRLFAPEEDQPGKNDVVVLTHGFWQRRFGGDAHIVGRTIHLDGRGHTVIGILPPRFLPWDDREFVVPTAVDPKDAEQRAARWLQIIGRLKPGVTLEQAQAEMDVVAARLRPLYSSADQDWGVTLVPMHEQITGDIRPTLLVLISAVGFVLLIACANIANLLLARSAGRQKEIAVRAALGAGRGRIVRQLLVESMLLSALGALSGLWLAQASVSLLPHLPAAINLPRVPEVGLDLRVVGFALLASVGAGLAFGLAPALHASRIALSDILKDGVRASSAGPRQRARNGLIIGEVALSLVLLIGAGLLLNSFVRMLNVPPGVNSRNVLTMEMTLPDQKYPDIERRGAFWERVLERVQNLPGIEVAGAAWVTPMAGGSPDTSFTIIGRPEDPQLGYIAGIGYIADFNYCSPDYFRAAGIPLLKGRSFEPRDRVGAPGVVVISEALARAYFPDEEPLGKRIHLDAFTGKVDEGWEIVGVVADIRQRGLGENVRPCVYRPQAFGSHSPHQGTLIIRTAGSPMARADDVVKAIHEMDPDQPVANVRTLDRVVAALMAQRRFVLLLLGGFAGAALLLAAIGLYGVIAYAVSQRTREIGIRMALGASRGNVLGLVLRQGLTLAGIGVALGVPAALGMTRLLTTFLYEVKPGDPLTFVGVSLTLLLVALLACFIPARRAARVDPMVALRAE